MKTLPRTIITSLQDGGRDLTILAIRLGAMGDILRTLPAFRLMRRSLPSARMLFLVDHHWSRLLDDHPDVDDVLTVPRREMDNMLRSPIRWTALAGKVFELRSSLRLCRADIVVDFHGNLRSGVAGWLSGADVRLGYAGWQQKEGNKLFTTHRVEGGGRRTPRMERNLALVRALGLPVDPLPGGGLPERGQIASESVELCRAALGGQSPYAVMSPGASARQSYKKPPTQLLATAAGRLADRGIGCLVVYGPGEEEDALAVAEASDGRAAVSPPTSLELLAGLLRRARMFIGGDTGPLHLACAVGCPVIGIYGPTDPEVNSPWKVPHVKVFPPGRVYTGKKRADRESGLFEGISMDQVRSAVDRLIDLESEA